MEILKIEILLKEGPTNVKILYTKTPTIIPTMRVTKNPINYDFFFSEDFVCKIY